jgi:hypothetical protein
VRFISIRGFQKARGQCSWKSAQSGNAGPKPRPALSFDVSQTDWDGYPSPTGLTTHDGGLTFAQLSAALGRCTAPAASATPAWTTTAWTTLTKWVRRHVGRQRWLRP